MPSRTKPICHRRVRLPPERQRAGRPPPAAATTSHFRSGRRGQMSHERELPADEYAAEDALYRAREIRAIAASGARACAASASGRFRPSPATTTTTITAAILRLQAFSSPRRSGERRCHAKMAYHWPPDAEARAISVPRRRRLLTRGEDD